MKRPSNRTIAVSLAITIMASNSVAQDLTRDSLTGFLSDNAISKASLLSQVGGWSASFVPLAGNGQFKLDSLSLGGGFFTSGDRFTDPSSWLYELHGYDSRSQAENLTSNPSWILPLTVTQFSYHPAFVDWQGNREGTISFIPKAALKNDFAIHPGTVITVQCLTNTNTQGALRYVEGTEGVPSTDFWLNSSGTVSNWSALGRYSGRTAIKYSFSPTATPEPASMIMLGMGALGLLRKRKRSC